MARSSSRCEGASLGWSSLEELECVEVEDLSGVALQHGAEHAVAAWGGADASAGGDGHQYTAERHAPVLGPCSGGVPACDAGGGEVVGVLVDEVAFDGASV